MYHPLVFLSSCAIMKVAQLASFHFNSLMRAEVQMCWASQTPAAAEKCHSGARAVELALAVHFSCERKEVNFCGSFLYAAWKYTHPHHTMLFLLLTLSCLLTSTNWVFSHALSSKKMLCFLCEGGFTATQTYAPSTTQTHSVKYEWLCDLYSQLCSKIPSL